MWENRNETLGALLCSTAVFALLRFTHQTVPTLAALLGGIGFVCLLAYVQLANFLPQGMPKPPTSEMQVELSEEYMRKLIEAALPKANRSLVYLFQATRLHDMSDIKKTCIVRYFFCCSCK